MSAFRFMAAAFVALLSVSAVSYTDVAEAQARKPAAKTKGKNSLESSKRFKVGKDQTKVDFDEASIEGQAKNPFGTMLNSREQDFNRGFIKLRYNWHDYMKLGAMGMSQ